MSHFMSIRDISDGIEYCTGTRDAEKAEHNTSGLTVFQRSACGCVHISMYHHSGKGGDHKVPCAWCKDGYQATEGNHSVDMCDMHYRYMNLVV